MKTPIVAINIEGEYKVKKAFTLVELLVVIAIIGILAGVLMSTFSGGTDSAKSARCLSNLRNLGAAALSYASYHGYYPVAGSYEMVKDGVGSNGETKNAYYPMDGWISWNSLNKYDANHQQSNKSLPNVSMYSSDQDERRHSLTNGSIYSYMNGNHSAYICPLHAIKKKDAANGLGPNFSYVMNAYFKWNHKQKTRLYGDRGQSYSSFKRADRRLMFAEIQFVDDSKLKLTSSVAESGDSCDAILQYSGCSGCGTPESIGFNHKTGKQYHAHVCYADGHTEKITLPKNGLGESERQELTKWLCEGKDISFDGTRYEELTN